MTRPLCKSVETSRDVILIRLDQKRILVVSCDSTGAVGQNRLDALRVRPSIVGKFTARVALMEVMAVGARPICVSVALCVEPAPTGREIMNGVREELRASRLQDIAVVQSSEKNFLVKQTGVGTMVDGIVEGPRLRIGRCKPDDWIIAVGKPKVGREVIEGERTGSITDVNDALDLLDLPYVHEIIPVGSRGIRREAITIATDSKLHFYSARSASVDVKKSAGPATVIICAVDSTKWNALNRAIDKPLSFVGTVG
jgi:hypothetical protein